MTPDTCEGCDAPCPDDTQEWHYDLDGCWICPDCDEPTPGDAP